MSINVDINLCVWNTYNNVTNISECLFLTGYFVSAVQAWDLIIPQYGGKKREIYLA